MNAQTDILQARHISKTFPGVSALSDISFALRSGEIHALMGENGAGKSTLIKVLTGVEQPDEGEILLAGAPVAPRSPHQAQELGISTVYQEVNLCPNLSVGENIFIGRAPRRFGRIDWKTIYARAEEALSRLSVEVDVRQPLGSYPVAIQQMVAIARALDIRARVLILDEPTSCLSADEVDRLFEVMQLLKRQGLGIVFVSHFLDQVYEVSDRISVLRHGRMIGTYDAANLSRLELIAAMIGKELEKLEYLTRIKQVDGVRAETLLQVRGLGKAGTLEPLDLDVPVGQVVGLAGLLGSGRTETARLLFGVDQPDSGSIRLRGEELKAHSPAQSLDSGIGMCPEDRRSDGIIPDLSVRENIILALQSSRGWLRRLSLQQQSELAERYIKALNIKTPSPDQPVKNLSGGNQQKVILARWLATNPRLLILDEPTRGIDIGAKTEIQRLVLGLADEGKSVIFISSELDEVLRCSHQVAVLRDRRKVAELTGDELQEANVMRAIAERESHDSAVL